MTDEIRQLEDELASLRPGWGLSPGARDVKPLTCGIALFAPDETEVPLDRIAWGRTFREAFDRAMAA